MHFGGTTMTRTKLALCLGLGTLFVLSQVHSQQPTAVAQNQPVQSFESKFWDYLQQVQYRNWAPAAGQGLDVYEGQAPHGAYLKMYVNRIAAADPKNLPHGSIIIKENFDNDKKTLAAVTAMYRVKGFDADHNDWYWVKYNPDGTVAKTSAEDGNKPVAGKVKACIDCHSGAKGGDYYFANDK